MALLEVQGLVKYYGRRKVVDGVSFSVEAGEVVGLLGPNGAGKTTSFRMTTGQIAPNDGAVQFADHDVTRLPMYKRARIGMGYLSQEASIFRKLTVEQNIYAILEALPVCRSLGRKLYRSERWDRTDAVLDQFGLNHVRKNNAARCSGGEKRRLEIARCLVCEPLLILLDEPFAAVDPLTKSDIQRIVVDLARQGIGILLTDHDVREVLKITHRSYLIKDGQVIVHGTPHEIVRNPLAVQTYLGNTFEDDGLGGNHLPTGPALPPPVAGGVSAGTLGVRQVLEQEQIHRLIESLKSNDTAAAALADLVARGPAVLPELLDAMERRDLELRRRAYMVLQHLIGQSAAFDPYAPEAQRRQQIAALRDRLTRPAA
jgi:lipopolysaccharide export system ATP-binding protein